jgi:hypothetical protein
VAEHDADDDDGETDSDPPAGLAAAAGEDHVELRLEELERQLRDEELAREIEEAAQAREEQEAYVRDLAQAEVLHREIHEGFAGAELVLAEAERDARRRSGGAPDPEAIADADLERYQAYWSVPPSRRAPATGRLALKVPVDLHVRLIEVARERGLSVNALCASVLAAHARLSE